MSLKRARLLKCVSHGGSGILGKKEKENIVSTAGEQMSNEWPEISADLQNISLRKDSFFGDSLRPEFSNHTVFLWGGGADGRLSSSPTGV